jgi:kinesin family protein 5
MAATGMNLGSSRSHSILSIVVKQTRLDTDVVIEGNLLSLYVLEGVGKLDLIDLAGSEMIRKTNATGQQLEVSADYMIFSHV